MSLEAKGQDTAYEGSCDHEGNDSSAGNAHAGIVRARGFYNQGMSDGVRLDVWLDVACVVSTRSQAKSLCDGGKVRVNGARAKAHRDLAIGDRVEVTVGPGLSRELLVRNVADRHVSKAKARELYEDVTPPPSEAELELRRQRRYAPPPAPPRGSGRPEKRDRRRLDRLRER